MGKKKHGESAAKKNPNQPTVAVSAVPGQPVGAKHAPVAVSQQEPAASGPDSSEVESKMSANDGEMEELRHENQMLKEELNAEIDAANELRLAVAHQTSLLYVTAAVAAGSLAAAAYLAARLRQNHH